MTDARTQSPSPKGAPTLRRAAGASSLRGLLAVAACALGFATFAPAASAQAEARCVAGAVTAVGTIVPNTRTAEVRRRVGPACQIALDECQHALQRERRRGGFDYPLARCEVLSQQTAQGFGHPPRGHYADARCVAQAFTRRGVPVEGARAVESAPSERRACAVAIATCERRLDRERHQRGRDMPFARCEVVRSSAEAAPLTQGGSRIGAQLGIVSFGFVDRALR